MSISASMKNLICSAAVACFGPIDRVAVGADPQAMFFGAAVEAELWLRHAARADLV